VSTEDLEARIKELENAVEAAEARIATIEDAVTELAKELGFTVTFPEP
jgi:uncharacterized coiled-coil protein SlyX